MSEPGPPLGKPTILPLGDGAVLVRFGETLTQAGNSAAVAYAAALRHAQVPGMVEVVSNLVSVLVRYDPLATAFQQMAGELRLRLAGVDSLGFAGSEHRVQVRFGGADGPDLEAVAHSLHLNTAEFVKAHNQAPLRVLATGFAPGFVYCGFHPPGLVLPRRTQVRRAVPAGSILFAAGQTAIAATEIPTGWHVIGRTGFRNFDPAAASPTRLAAGDRVVFEAEP